MPQNSDIAFQTSHPYFQRALHQIQNIDDASLAGIRAIVELVYERATWVIDDKNTEKVFTSFKNGEITVHVSSTFFNGLLTTFEIETRRIDNQAGATNLTTQQAQDALAEYLSSFLALEIIEEASSLQYWVSQGNLENLPKLMRYFSARYVSFTYRLLFLKNLKTKLQNRLSRLSQFESFNQLYQRVASLLNDAARGSEDLDHATQLLLKYNEDDLLTNIENYYFDFLRYFRETHGLSGTIWFGNDDLTLEGVQYLTKQILEPSADHLFDVWKYLTLTTQDKSLLDLGNRGFLVDLRDIDQDGIIGEKMTARDFVVIHSLALYYYLILNLTKRRIKKLPGSLIASTIRILLSQLFVILISLGGIYAGKAFLNNYTSYQKAKEAYIATPTGSLAIKLGGFSGDDNIINVSSLRENLALKLTTHTHLEPRIIYVPEPHYNPATKSEEVRLVPKTINVDVADGIRLDPQSSYDQLATDLNRYYYSQTVLLRATERTNANNLRKYNISVKDWQSQIERQKKTAALMKQLATGVAGYRISIKNKAAGDSTLNKEYATIENEDDGANFYTLTNGETIEVFVARPGKTAIKKTYTGDVATTIDDTISDESSLEILREESGQLKTIKNQLQSQWHFFNDRVPKEIRDELTWRRFLTILWGVLVPLFTIVMSWLVTLGYTRKNLFHFRDFVRDVFKFVDTIENLPEFRQEHWQLYSLDPKNHGLVENRDVLLQQMKELEPPRNFLSLKPGMIIAPLHALPESVNPFEEPALTAA